MSEGFKVAMNWGNSQGAKETSYGSVSEALPEETGSNG